MLTQEQFFYLDGALRCRPTVKSYERIYPFNDGHKPKHLECHVTAMHLEHTKGWRAQIGIQWLDKGGYLLPWPHVINWVDDQLIDFSQPIDQPKLGFTLIGNDVAMANAITTSTGHGKGVPSAGDWNDPLLGQLHRLWFSRLKLFSASPDYRFNSAAVAR